MYTDVGASFFLLDTLIVRYITVVSQRQYRVTTVPQGSQYCADDAYARALASLNPSLSVLLSFIIFL